MQQLLLKLTFLVGIHNSETIGHHLHCVSGDVSDVFTTNISKHVTVNCYPIEIR